MYKSEFFFAEDKNRQFYPMLISVFNISADSSYHHICDDEEKSKQGESAVAFIRCINGSGKIRFYNKEITINKNEYIFLKFHDIKDYKSTSAIWEYRWVNFKTENSEEDYKLGKIYNAPFCENEDKAFHKLLLLGKSETKYAGYINSLFLNYYYTVTFESRLNIAENSFGKNNELIDEMCAFIHQKIYSKITIDDIAVFFRISPRRVHQIFTKELNISPKQYIIQTKMEHSYKLLTQTAMPINKIADMLCFSSPYHFSTEFKKMYSLSPSVIRKSKRNK